MSTLERLSASVAKLLTEAVQEVLEVVKETVSEYEERAARTQRENDSLKQRLQELQNKIPVEKKPVLQEKFPEEKDKDTENLGSGINGAGLILCPQFEVTLTELKHKSSHDSDHNFLLCSQNSKSESESILVQTFAGNDSKQAGEVTPIKEEPVAVQISHTVIAGSPDEASCSTFNANLGVNVAIVKREPQPTECEIPQPPLQEHFSGSVDLSCNSTESRGSKVGTESYGLLYVRSNHRRHGFAGRKLRMEHIRSNDIHMCIVCGKTFSRLGNLKIHQRCHTGEKPYGCMQCGRRFIQAGDLKKHKRVHTGEKPYYCNLCGKSFSRGENLKRHKKIHIGESSQMT